VTENENRSWRFLAMCSDIGIFRIFGEKRPGIIKIMRNCLIL
jgi:hypothetical protein